ncbi:MAG: DUF4157 domain-containing protein [Leptolyngbyaceae cyanobacterium]
MQREGEEEELQMKPQEALQREPEEEEDLQMKPQEVLQREPEEEEEMQMKPQEALQREPEEEEEMQMKPTLQRVGKEGGAVDAGLESQIQGAKGNGQPLDKGLQQSMGQAMGADFSGVKVHTDTQSDQLNQSIQAKAFTTGQDLFFRQGEYNPDSRSGQELIAHELTHVVQQNSMVQAKAEAGGVQSISGPTAQASHSDTIQRFDVNQVPLPFGSTQSVDMTEGGAVGAFIFSDGTNKPAFVTPDSGREPAAELMFASTFHQRLAGANAPFLRLATDPERQDIVQALNNPFITDWDALNKKRESRFKTPEEMQAAYLSEFNQRAFIMEQVDGKNFGKIKSQSDLMGANPGRMQSLLINPEYLKQIGKIHAVDLFFGNTDRFTSNLGNWMTDGNDKISAIDNVGGGEGKFGQHFQLNAQMYKKLAKSKLTATAKEVAKGLVRMCKLPNTWVTANKDTMLKNIKIGLLAGRKRIIKKLGPRRLGKRSRTLKLAVTGAAASTGEDPNTMWSNVKKRVKQLSKL